MFHMLSCFDLDNGVGVSEFKKTNAVFFEDMKALDLVKSIGPIGRRNKHPIMDTDKERDQEYFYIMSFVDENQCNKAVEYIQSKAATGDKAHRDLISKITNSVFLCWEDV